MGPVFTFDVGIVVFLVFSGASELDGFIALLKVIEEKAVDEFAAVIEIDAEDNERQGIFHIFDLLRDFTETFAVGGSLFGPAGGNVDGIGGNGVMAFYGAAAVGDGVCFKKTRFEFIPLFCFDGDVMFEEESWFGGASSFAPVEPLDGFEKTVDGGRGDLQEFLDDVKGKRTVVDLVRTDPVVDSGFKPLGTDEIGADPDGL